LFGRSSGVAKPLRPQKKLSLLMQKTEDSKENKLMTDLILSSFAWFPFCFPESLELCAKVLFAHEIPKEPLLFRRALGVRTACPAVCGRPRVGFHQSHDIM
jgi:hypothetical protein